MTKEKMLKEILRTESGYKAYANYYMKYRKGFIKQAYDLYQVTHSGAKKMLQRNLRNKEVKVK